VDATITLDSGCLINGTNTSNGAATANFGTLDFQTQTTLFSQATAQVLGSGAGITIQCTAGVAPTLVFQHGQHDASAASPGNKAMLHTITPGQFVSYNLLRDDGSTVINDGDTIVLLTDGTAQTVTVRGRAYGASGLIAGTYNDTVTVL